eukprot:3796224-Ditylum_brightwellii.AAC.1
MIWLTTGSKIMLTLFYIAAAAHLYQHARLQETAEGISRQHEHVHPGAFHSGRTDTWMMCVVVGALFVYYKSYVQLITSQNDRLIWSLC